MLARAYKPRPFWLTLVVLTTLLAIPAWADEVTVLPLDRGFRHLYDLDFEKAQAEFSAWQRQHPQDPLGPASEAAGLLFSEFHRLGILEAQFYQNDAAFQARRKLSPDPAVHDHFEEALERAENLARARLEKAPKDRDALFAMTLTTGLRADYAALIEKSNLASLRYTRQATAWAQQVLAVDPECYDAYLARGISRYIIGSMAAPVRWLLRLGGVDGDKQGGISDLQLTARRGHYLAPFARILLAIAYVRDKDKPRARQVLASLREEFPNNPLFEREMERLNSGP
jgi:hypothetical protein